MLFAFLPSAGKPLAPLPPPGKPLADEELPLPGLLRKSGHRLGCNSGGCGMPVPGIGRNSSSQSSRDSHPKLSSNTHSPSLATSLSFLHPPLIPPPDRATSQPCLTHCHKIGKQKLQHAFFRQANSTKAKANTTEFELWSNGCRCTYSNLPKKQLSSLESNHKNSSIDFITEIILSI